MKTPKQRLYEAGMTDEMIDALEDLIIQFLLNHEQHMHD